MRRVARERFFARARDAPPVTTLVTPTGRLPRPPHRRPLVVAGIAAT